jgi:hypothetical protein
MLAPYTKWNVFVVAKKFSYAGVGIWPRVRMLEALENQKVLCAASKKTLN